jgi:hypothetical protein
MARQIIYVLNMDRGTPEVETDADDSIEIPASGSCYSHKGKSWVVGTVENCQMIGVTGPIRTVRIFLTAA